MPLPGFGIRGADIDSQGVVWGSLASGHLSAFDRSKCTAPLNGPEATGDHCPEGWTLYRYPAPVFRSFRSTASSRAITVGSISTIPPGLVMTFRCRPLISTTAFTRS